MQKLTLLLAILLPIVVLCQDQCPQCKLTFVITGKNLYKIDANDTKTLCMSGFSDARSFDFDVDGNIYVADGGNKSIWKIDPQCQNKEVFIANDYKTKSWLSPYDLTLKSDKSVMYVSMMDIDPLWMTYEFPRNLFAKERHVYALYLDADGKFNGTAEILASGVDNGKHIKRIIYFNGTLWGIRKDKYSVRLVDGVWYDAVDDQHAIVKVTNSDFAFDLENCSFFDKVPDLKNQLKECPNSISKFLRNDDPKRGDLLPFIRDEDCIELPEDEKFDIKFEIDEFQQLNKSICNQFLVPHTLSIDCECHLLVGSIGNEGLVAYSFDEVTKQFLHARTLDLQEPIYTIIPTFANCSATPEPEPEPEPTATATPEPTAVPKRLIFI